MTGRRDEDRAPGLAGEGLGLGSRAEGQPWGRPRLACPGTGAGRRDARSARQGEEIMELPVLNFKFLPDRCHWGRNSSCLQRQEGGGRGGPWRAPHSLGSGSGSLSVVWSHMPPHFAEPFPNRLHNLAVGSSLGGEAGVHVPLSQEDGGAEKSRHAPKSHSMLVGEQSFQARSDSTPLPAPPGPFSFPVSPLTGTDCLSFAC